MVRKSFDFNDLVVFDLANNHQGSVEHGLAIIRGVGAAAKSRGARAALKFQFRELDSFIHPTHQSGSDNKHIPRFLETRLSPDQYKLLLDEVRAQGMLAMCTPFDEGSVDLIEDMGFDLLKIASCSAKDWPLLTRAARAGLPVVVSTGGLDVPDIDNLVSFFEHRGVDFAMMHCVAVYPTPADMCNLNQIETLIERCHGRAVGWSTHEDPDETAPATVAYAKGARIFERHVGLSGDGISLNAYSSTPEQVERWLDAIASARALCGPEARPPVPKAEADSLASLKRGVYSRRAIKEGRELSDDDVYFAMPWTEGQLDSGAWKPGAVAKRAFDPDAPLAEDAVAVSGNPDVQVIKKAVHEVRAMLHRARIALNSEFEVEYSHHYGVSNFRDTGAIIITCVNRDYCKKLVVQLPGQKHPLHYHRLKEETFQVLDGVLRIELDGRVKTLTPGETVVVMPGAWHGFSTEGGVIFEEISTTSYPNDSFYADPKINEKTLAERKTKVDHWGRYQIGEDGKSGG